MPSSSNTSKKVAQGNKIQKTKPTMSLPVRPHNPALQQRGSAQEFQEPAKNSSQHQVSN
ncbi:Small muscular protein [Caenorhabditis elegans]|uniref:Small muscular protein n=1 Tax=Caenorhabditis elegans TaxID=6239 RepID=Q19167_CAEEL|nr:Small muscular protein [Caenorhabditis elegans]CCD66888.1 Small muscular protein [Caenorhabditis elegans]|eukprot:NP_508313.1 Uncharacterized protein CELE_F07G6.5 [Caenorhabditis elegans]